MDQMRPEYVDVFDMDNVRGLIDDGVNYEDAYLGHMGSETVITHNVLATGVLPKNMGWSDEVQRDVDNVLGGGAGAFYVTSSLARDQFFMLQADSGVKRPRRLPPRDAPGDEVHHRRGEDDRHLHLRRPSADIIVTLSGRNFDCAGVGNTYRGPTGVAVPGYLSAPPSGSHDSNANLDYGTRTDCPACMYPEDGNRFVPGLDPAHLGGDTWVADACRSPMMANEPWSGMLVSFGGIDKIGHMWGGITDTGSVPGPVQTRCTRTSSPRTPTSSSAPPDRRARGERSARRDADRPHHGPRREPGAQLPRDQRPQPQQLQLVLRQGRGRDLPDAAASLAPLIATGNIAFNYQDSADVLDQSTAKKREAAAAMATLPR